MFFKYYYYYFFFVSVNPDRKNIISVDRLLHDNDNKYAYEWNVCMCTIECAVCISTQLMCMQASKYTSYRDCIIILTPRHRDKLKLWSIDRSSFRWSNRSVILLFLIIISIFFFFLFLQRLTTNFFFFLSKASSKVIIIFFFFLFFYFSIFKIS